MPAPHLHGHLRHLSHRQPTCCRPTAWPQQCLVTAVPSRVSAASPLPAAQIRKPLGLAFRFQTVSVHAARSSLSAHNVFTFVCRHAGTSQPVTPLLSRLPAVPRARRPRARTLVLLSTPEAQRRSASPRPPPPSPLSLRCRPPREQAPPPGPTTRTPPRVVNGGRRRSARGTDQGEGGAGGLDLPLADRAHSGPHHRRCHHAPPPRPLPSAMGTTDVTPRHRPARRASAIRPHWAAENDGQAVRPAPSAVLRRGRVRTPVGCVSEEASRLVRGDKGRAGPGPAPGPHRPCPQERRPGDADTVRWKQGISSLQNHRVTVKKTSEITDSSRRPTIAAAFSASVPFLNATGAACASTWSLWEKKMLPNIQREVHSPLQMWNMSAGLFTTPWEESVVRHRSPFFPR